jgi:hypothetical protein
MIPILEEGAKEKIRQEVFEPFLTDNSRARKVERRRDSPGRWKHRSPACAARRWKRRAASRPRFPSPPGPPERRPEKKTRRDGATAQSRRVGISPL